MGNRRGRLTVGDERRQIIASVKGGFGLGSSPGRRLRSDGDKRKNLPEMEQVGQC